MRSHRKGFIRRLPPGEDILGCTVAAFVILLIVLFIYLIVRDPCNSQQITNIICDMYEEGSAVGSLCHSMCRQAGFSLGHCVSQSQQYVEFQRGEGVYRVTGDLTRLRASPSLSYPPDNTTVGAFTATVRHYLWSQLGHTDQSTLLNHLLHFADSNKDGQLSLTETRTLWTLLHSPDFLTLFIFQGHYHFPKINGTCGRLIALQNVFHSPIYMKPSDVKTAFLPFSYLWGAPAWNMRVKVAVGLLEALFTLYETSNVEFNLCDVHAHSLTFNPRNYEGAISDVSSIISQHLLRARLSNRTCETHRDCWYSPHCTSICDPQTRTCSGVPTVPMLAHLCSVLIPYLVPGSPRSVTVELRFHLKRCSRMDNHGDDYELRNNVVMNHLSTFLWHLIMWDKDS